jgi:hypothetical protein
LDLNRPIIVSALFGAADFAWFDGQRRQWFPPERNQLPAHLTLFHHLPPSVKDELKSLIKHETLAPPPRAEVGSLMPLGGGTAYRIISPALEAIRDHIADRFAPLLIPQDKAGWRPHVTIQNKVKPAVAKQLLAALSADFRPRTITIAVIGAWYYCDGPWEPIAAYGFSGAHMINTPPMPRPHAFAKPG